MFPRGGCVLLRVQQPQPLPPDGQRRNRHRHGEAEALRTRLGPRRSAFPAEIVTPEREKPRKGSASPCVSPIQPAWPMVTLPDGAA